MLICQKKKSNDSDVNKWTGNQCKQFLKDHKALQTGNVKDLRERCVSLEKLIKKICSESYHLL